MYCERCKIGTLDADGLCVLCGAPKVPASRTRRLLAATLTVLTSPPALALSAVVLLLLTVLALGRYAAPSPAWGSRLALLNPLTVPFALRSSPHGTLIAVVAPLIGQAIIVLVILLILFLIARRRRPEKRGAAETP